ncbi:MAG: ABC transporter substrate-binding protein [Burkholderiaceae bacterium]|nr:MAG: ABC transporter substrate-binding protein [Burkholderiaceae bacterium]
MRKRQKFFAGLLWGLGTLLPLQLWAAHGLALYGEPKYPPGFTHFEYVNPDAPRGGSITLSMLGNYDKLNPFTLKGIAAIGLDQLVFESLATSSMDEPASIYGVLAQDMVLAPDRSSVTFRLHPAARFSNGDAVTAADVKYSFDTLRSKLASPVFRTYWADVKGAVVLDARTIRFDLAPANRELFMVIATQLPVFSKKWGMENGVAKPFDQIVFDTPIASGPYLVDQVDLGRNISYRRNPDYWGKDIPARRGTFNFDRVTFRYYADEFSRIQAYRAGEFDFIHENAAKNWARNYFGAKFESGELIKTELPNSNSQGMQCFVFNIRRDKFKDWRVRRAIALAMDFEWMNRQLFYNQYTRNPSFFTNTEFAATGTPSAAELKLLEPYRAQLSPRVFEAVLPPPTTKPPHSLRDNLREARALLAEAGWAFRDGALRNAQGEAFEFEVLLDTRTWERIVAPFARNLDKLGIHARARVTDASLYKKRVDDYDYDMIVHWFTGSQTPGNELMLRFASAAADEKGADNFIGLKDPVVDALIHRVLMVNSMEELLIASRALDRVLLAGQYVIPHFHNRVHRVSFKSTLAHPATLPLYYQSLDWMLMSWWVKQGMKGK